MRTWMCVPSGYAEECCTKWPSTMLPPQKNKRFYSKERGESICRRFKTKELQFQYVLCKPSLKYRRFPLVQGLIQQQSEKIVPSVCVLKMYLIATFCLISLRFYTYAFSFPWYNILTLYLPCFSWRKQDSPMFDVLHFLWKWGNWKFKPYLLQSLQLPSS